MADNVHDLWDRYKKFVANNAEYVSQVESTVRAISYVIAGRFESSGVLSELVYSASNLLVLLNDTILRTAHNLKPKVFSDANASRLQTWLTVLDHCEVFLELAAYKLWGNAGKWVVVTCIQLVKTALRYLLLFKYDTGIQPVPSVAPLNREKDIPNTDNADNAQNDDTSLDAEMDGCVTVTLQRSGKTIRKLAAAPPVKYRTWKVPSAASETNVSPEKTEHGCSPTKLSKNRRYSESLHVARPLVHLFSMYLFGEKAWKPWLIASAVDVSSLYLMGDYKDMNPVEKAELARRHVYLLYYLLRSPFYDRHSKMKIMYILRAISSKIPGASMIIEPLLQYLPIWQKVYFYTWSL